jgi:Skp family chaperone for outer membrane proteins
MKATTFLTPIACGAILAALSFAAIAQGAARKTITRDEYRACMNSQDALQARGDAIKQRTASIQRESEALKAEEDQLTREQKRVEESSFSGARERFERKVKAHSARVKAAEEEGRSLKAEADGFTKDLDAHNASCSDVAINKEDREAVMKEREAAGKK